ncbi:hypothetical protein HII31_12825 [Pseudocercospora fuligena]|uniref:Uncharacterized protein n=1 Tax=Pseudocercospora fuligena TaxID=685502 RepID=A0A8H6VCV9_9PEZI|nr:hypothetical protein HII31_12825 [Pseudocercospora fuligena]
MVTTRRVSRRDQHPSSGHQDKRASKGATRKQIKVASKALRHVKYLDTRQYQSLLDLNSDLKKYNKLLAFVPPDRASSAAKRHDNVLAACKKIQMAWQALFINFEELEDEALDAMEDVKSQIYSNSHWYENADLLSLEVEELDDIFDREEIVDAGHFSDYLLQLVSRHLQVERKYTDAKGNRVWSLADYFLSSFQRLREALKDSSDPRARSHFFRFNAQLMGVVLPQNRLLHEDIEVHFFNLISCIEMRSELAQATPATYLDCAKARREIWKRYSKLDCKLEPYEGYSDRKCFHQTTIGLLQDLQTRAQQEIRCKVILAVGTYLPAEIADVIVDSVLILEEVPVESSVAEEPGTGTYLHSVLPNYDCGRVQYLSHRHRNFNLRKERKELEGYDRKLDEEIRNDPEPKDRNPVSELVSLRFT